MLDSALPELLMTPLALGYLANFLLLALSSWYMFANARRRGTSLAAKRMLGCFVFLGVFSLLSLGEEGLYQPWNLYCLYCENLVICISQWFLLQFVYLFPRESESPQGEARIVSGISFVIILVEVAHLAYRLHSLLSTGEVIWRNPGLDSLTIGQFIWGVIVLLRKTMRAASDDDTRPAIIRILKPRSRDAKAAQRVAAVMLWGAVVAFLSELEVHLDILGLITSLGTLAGVCAFMLIYLNYVALSISLRAKLVGLGLSTMLAILTLIHWTVVTLYFHDRIEEARQNESRSSALLAANQSLRCSPNQQGGYDISRVPTHFDFDVSKKLETSGHYAGLVDIPFSFKYFGKERPRLYAKLDGFIAFSDTVPSFGWFRFHYGSRPVILAGLVDIAIPKDQQSGIFYKANEESVTVLWRDVSPDAHPNSKNTFEVVLHRGGVIDLNYKEIHTFPLVRFLSSPKDAWLVGLLPGNVDGPPSQSVFADGSLQEKVMISGPEGVVQDNVLAMRRRLAPLSQRMALITLLATLIIAVGAPLILRTILVEPLTRLVSGISSVNAGRLDTHVEVSRQDEIGFLTSSFNKMVASIRAASTELSLHRDRLEELVQKRTEELQREVKAKELMAGELEKAKLAAEAASQAKSLFLATMSHEIRTPMNGVIGMISLLMDTNMTSEQRHYAETIGHCGESLLTLVNDILDFSKIEAGKLELEKSSFDLRASFEETIDLLAPRAAEKGLELLCWFDDTLPAHVLGDVTRLRQVMLNLVGNAVKFTERGEVVMTVRNVPQQDSGSILQGSAPSDQPRQLLLECCVCDTGVGISSEGMGRLFESFSQADISTTRRFGGTGLGLAISKRLVEAMEGRIWVESAPGKGSRFYFTAVLDVVDAESPLWARAQGQIAGRRALVIDHNQSIRDLVSHYLTLWGATTETHATLTSAGAALKSSTRWDVVIVDAKLLEKNVDRNVMLLREHFAKSNLPVIWLVSSQPSARRRSAPLPNSKTIRKPIRPSRLLAELQQLFHETAPKREAISSNQSSPAQVVSPLRLLVADDNSVNQLVVRSYLRRLGYNAEVAASGNEVLAAVARQNFDLILMDVQMPDMDGISATLCLKAQLPSEEMPIIIALSAGVSESEREKCRAAGMDDFLAKPIQPADLIAMFDRLKEPIRHRLERNQSISR